MASASEEPATVVLGFDHEYPEAGNQDMVDLGSSVCNWNSQMVQKMKGPQS